MTAPEPGTLEEARAIATALKAALPDAVDAIKQGITHQTVFYLVVARESLLHPRVGFVRWHCSAEPDGSYVRRQFEFLAHGFKCVLHAGDVLMRPDNGVTTTTTQ